MAQQHWGHHGRPAAIYSQDVESKPYSGQPPACFDLSVLSDLLMPAASSKAISTVIVQQGMASAGACRALCPPLNEQWEWDRSRLPMLTRAHWHWAIYCGLCASPSSRCGTQWPAAVQASAEIQNRECVPDVFLCCPTMSLQRHCLSAAGSLTWRPLAHGSTCLLQGSEAPGSAGALPSDQTGCLGGPAPTARCGTGGIPPAGARGSVPPFGAGLEWGAAQRGAQVRCGTAPDMIT